MTVFWWIIAIGLLMNIVAGMYLVTTRKGGPESLLAALLFATTGTALTLLLGMAMQIEHAVDVALVFALLAAVLGVAFARQGWLAGRGGKDRAS